LREGKGPHRHHAGRKGKHTEPVHQTHVGLMENQPLDLKIFGGKLLTKKIKDEEGRGQLTMKRG